MKYRDKWDRVIKAPECIFSESAMSELESLETQRTYRQLADSPFDRGRFDSFLSTVTKHKYRTIQCIVMINNWIWYGVLLNWNIHIWIHELLWEIEYVEEGKVRADFIKCGKFKVTNCLLYRTVCFYVFRWLYYHIDYWCIAVRDSTFFIQSLHFNSRQLFKHQTRGNATILWWQEQDIQDVLWVRKKVTAR